MRRTAAIITCALLLAACRVENRPPSQPYFAKGQNLGMCDVTYQFRAVSGDSDGDAISYRFDWGDGHMSDWSVALPSDSPFAASHAWQDSGRYQVWVWARDEHGLSAASASTNGITVVDNAPDFSLTDLGGDTVNLYHLLEAGPVYMVWWDLPCVNCIAEIDDLQPVYDSLASRGFTLLAVSVDKAENEARVRSFVAAKGWRCPVLLDSSRLTKDLYGVIIKPTGILVSMDTAIVYQHIGYKKGEWETIQGEILKWLPPRLALGLGRGKI